MTQYVISDTHFGHGNIIELGKRKFENVDVMNETMIHNWNHVVNRDDTVFHLGDFGWKNTEYNMDILSRLKGQIVLLGGNHDSAKSLKAYHRMGIQIQDYLEIAAPVSHKRICLFHYPMAEWNGYFSGALHLHGHTHKPIYSDMPGRYNICVEAIGYTPKPLKDVEREHFELIDHIKGSKDHDGNHIQN